MKFSHIILLLVLPFLVLFAFSTSRKPDVNELKFISYFTTNQEQVSNTISDYDFINNYQRTDLVEIKNKYIWVKVEGDAFAEKKKLKINNQLIPRIDQYVLRNGFLELVDSSGYQVPCKYRTYCHQQFMFDILPEVNYYRIENPDIISNLRLELRTEQTFIRENKSDQIGYGTFYGVFVFFVVLNGFLYVQLRDISYFSNLMFTLLLAISIAFFDGNMNKTIFQGIGLNNYYISRILFQVLLFNHLIFANRYFNTPPFNAFWKRSFQFLVVFQALILITAFVPLGDYNLFFNYVSLYNFFAQIVFVSILFLRILYEKKHPNRKFILAYVPVLLLVVTYILKVLGLDYFRYNYNSIFYTCVYALVFILAVFIIDAFASYKAEATTRLLEMSKIKNYNNLNLEKKISEETHYLKEQKDLLALKNKELLDSFHYAKHIQNSLLTTEATIQSIFPNSFLLFETKEILSTDFYWVTRISTEKNPDLVLFCLGSPNQTGIPGTLINAIILKTIRNSIHSNKLSNTARVNNYIQHRLDEVLAKNGVDANNKMIIGVFNPKSLQLSFSGDLSFIEIIRNGAPLNRTDFTQQTESFLQNYTTEEYSIKLNPNDQIYLFSGGIKEAINTKGKHYFIQYLMQLSLYPTLVQKEKLIQTLQDIEVEKRKDQTFISINVSHED